MKPIGAPACYAAASIFSQDSNTCKVCKVFAECSVASFETLQAIKHLINVDDLLKRHAAARKTALVKIAQADEERHALTPPGKAETPVAAKPIERKTKVVDVKFEATPSEDQILLKMPVKPREIAARMIKMNDVEGVRKALATGQNYYAERGPAFMRVAVGHLLSGGFTKRSLRVAFEADLGWTEGTAASHVGIACVIVLAFKFAQETKGNFALIPESVA